MTSVAVIIIKCAGTGKDVQEQDGVRVAVATLLASLSVLSVALLRMKTGSAFVSSATILVEDC